MEKIIFESAYYGIILTIISYQLGIIVYRKTKILLLHPLIIAQTIIILTLYFTHLFLNQSLEQSLADYNIGSNFISFFLAPVTVMLALPMYRRIQLIKKYFIPLTLGVFTSVLINFIISTILIQVSDLNHALAMSIYTKNITTPMALSLTELLAGDIYITTSLVLFTGIFGALASPYIFKYFTMIKNPIAKGIAIGSNSHAVGTSKALEMGEIEGALSSTAIGLTGIITVIVVPVLIQMVY